MEKENLNIPETEYPSKCVLPPKVFSDAMKYLSSNGDTSNETCKNIVQISINKFKITLTSSGDVSNILWTISEKPGSSVSKS